MAAMIDQEKVVQAVGLLLEAIGEDPERPGLRDTPRRIARACLELFRGLDQPPQNVLEVLFQEPHEEMILVKDIWFYSMCEHHFLPFFGKAHVAYLPRDGRITGLSKLARVVDLAARRPQLQERLTSTVADTLMEKLLPHGAAVVIEAEHMCMAMRGIQKPGHRTVTSAMRGIFAENLATREEFMSLVVNR